VWYWFYFDYLQVVFMMAVPGAVAGAVSGGMILGFGYWWLVRRGYRRLPKRDRRGRFKSR